MHTFQESTLGILLAYKQLIPGKSKVHFITKATVLKQTCGGNGLVREKAIAEHLRQADGMGWEASGQLLWRTKEPIAGEGETRAIRQQGQQGNPQVQELCRRTHRRTQKQPGSARRGTQEVVGGGASTSMRGRVVEREGEGLSENERRQVRKTEEAEKESGVKAVNISD